MAIVCIAEVIGQNFALRLEPGIELSFELGIESAIQPGVR
jgi:hypothetical protein